MIEHIGRDTPLVGCIAFGIIDRGTNIIQVRPTSACNLNCKFCSVDSGVNSKWHQTSYEVDLDYLAEETEKVIAFKGCSVEVNIDSVGEPFSYPQIEELVNRLRKMQNVSKISIQTNGTIAKYLNVDVLNLSIHSIDPEFAREMSGTSCYDLNKVLELMENYLKRKIKVRLCPVWIPGINDAEIPKIIKLAKEKNCLLGIQKYEAYKYSRKMKAKPLNWFKFYRQIEKWEKEFNVELKMKAKDVGIEKAPRIPEVFKKGEKVQAVIVHKGWSKGQMIGVARDRCISINDCSRKIGDLANVEILETKNNIYLAK